MSRFVKVYVNPERDQSLTDNQVMFMRKDSSPFIEVEEGHLHLALDLLDGGHTVYSKSLVVIDGHLDTKGSINSIGGSVSGAMADLAKEKQAVVVLHSCGGIPTEEVRSEGEYFVDLYALPDTDEFKRGDGIPLAYVPHFVFDGVEMRARKTDYDIGVYSSSRIRDALEKTEKEYSVMEDDEGNIFALYTPFNAWIVARCARSEDTYHPADTFPAIFRKLLENMDSLVTNREEFMAAQEEVARLEILARWGSLVAGRHDQSVKICEEELVKASDNVVRLRIEMAETLLDISEREKVLRIAVGVRPNENALALEFSRIYENPWIEDITIDESGEWMTVFTRTLVMDGDEDVRTQNSLVRKRWEGKLVPIGKFSIRVNSSGRVELENLTNPKEREGNTWYHPHVPGAGSPCFGTIETSLPKMLAQYEFGSVIHLLTGFLTCCNADDAWGANICMWEEDAYPKPHHKTTETTSVEAEADAS